MEIKTKYNIGESRWLIHDNKVKEAKIYKIETNIECVSEAGTLTRQYTNKTTKNITYSIVMERNTRKEMLEEELEEKTFATKEELIKSL